MSGIRSTFFEISPLVNEGIGVWPGDVAFSRQVALDMSKGDHLTLSAVTSTVHLGAHADAPSHYRKDGEPIHLRNPLLYYGDCQVIQVQVPRGERLLPSHLPQGFSPVAERLLIGTGSFPDPQKFNEDFNSLSPDLIEYLAEREVSLVGIDTPSVDPFLSKALESHQALAKHDLAVLEGLVLRQVPEGVYTLIALPLRIEGADASPVRAILVKD